jgi:hypothetical protein
MEQSPEHIEHVRQVQAAASRNASWGTIIVIVVMLGMIVTGAFYAWGKRVAQEEAYEALLESQRY